ncbi:Protein dispatched homolog 3 (Patched domain-containing protein 2) (Thyroid hormone receptor up-regulated protein 1) (TRUP1), partial [Durusdinium trenchii]
MTGVVQFHEDGAYSVQLDEGSVVKVVPEQLSPVTEEQAALPPLSLALPVQEDLPDRTSRNTGPSVTGRNSELDTLQSLHINAGSLMGRLLLSYSQQVTKRPRRLMFFYALVVAVPVIVGIIFRGFDLETNFNAFIKADGAAMRDREAFELALSEKKDLSASRRLEAESLRLWEVNGDWVEAEADEDGRRLEPEPENWTSAPGRRLKTLFLRKDLQLLYRAKNGNIMDEKALQDIQQIEEGLRNLPRWQDSCLNKITGDVKRFLCDPGISIVAMAFPTPTSASQGTVFLQFTWDGLGRDVISSGAVLAYMKTSSESGDASRDSRRYFPKTYQFPEIGTDFEAAPGALPTAARTKFEFHMTLGQNGDPINQVNQNIQKVKAEWNEMIVQEMLPYFKEVQKRENPQVDFYYASGDIDSIEINSTLFSDLLMAIGSILFVILYLRVHTGSWIVSITAFAIIFISVPCAYILTPAAKATIASFLSVFLITGIGCDVVFVFTDFWEQGHKLPLESRCMCMIVHAGESCLATSITTALSFFANLASALQPLREFGMFMGLCVMCAFFLVLLMMPPLLVAVEKQKESAKLRVVDISSGQGVAAMQDEQKKKKKQKGTVMQAILFRLMSGIGACPCVILACTGIFFLTSVICVVTNAKLSTGVPDIFPAWHNQVSSKEVLGMFSTEADLTSAAPARGSVCRAETVNGTSTANCNLFWCEA